MTAHRHAVMTVSAACVLDVVVAVLFSHAEHVSVGRALYWAVATATTVGYGDVVPRTPLGHVLAVVVMLTVVPLFAATFSLFTTSLTATHVRRSEDRIKEHVARHAERPRAVAVVPTISSAPLIQSERLGHTRRP